MAARTDGLPPLCLACGRNKGGRAYVCIHCDQNGGGVSLRLVSDWDDGARDFPRKPAKVDDGAPEAWPAVTVGSRWDRYFDGKFTCVITVTAVDANGASFRHEDGDRNSGLLAAFRPGGHGGFEYRPHRKEAPAAARCDGFAIISGESFRCRREVGHKGACEIPERPVLPIGPADPCERCGKAGGCSMTLPGMPSAREFAHRLICDARASEWCKPWVADRASAMQHGGICDEHTEHQEARDLQWSTELAGTRTELAAANDALGAAMRRIAELEAAFEAQRGIDGTSRAEAAEKRVRELEAALKEMSKPCRFGCVPCSSRVMP